MYENQSMKRSLILFLPAVSLLTCLGCAPKRTAAPGSIAVPAASGGPLATRGKVVYFEGDVRIDGSAAVIGQELEAKALVETGPDASCDIVFDEKNAIRVSENAVASLDFSGIVKEVSLKRGGLSSVLRKLAAATATDSFRVETAVATAGVRGTCFFVWADGNSAYVCACNGKVRTIDSKGSNELVISAVHHSARNYIKEGSAIHVSPAALEHHGDASMESLAARIGEKIDWTKED